MLPVQRKPFSSLGLFWSSILAERPDKQHCRTAAALISYDATGTIVRNISHDGTRHVWGMVSNPLDRTVTILGQAAPVTYAKGDMGYSVTVPWSELGR